MVDASRQAWVDAVAAGETTDSFVDWWSAREREALADDDDGPEMIEFSFRIGVTTRAFYEIEFKAESLVEVKEHAATINPQKHLATFPESIEGDQIGYLRQSDDFRGEDIEVDLHDEGRALLVGSVRDCQKACCAIRSRPTWRWRLRYRS